MNGPNRITMSLTTGYYSRSDLMVKIDGGSVVCESNLT
jgi:hypothetical protein